MLHRSLSSVLANYRVILASASPRRVELLRQMQVSTVQCVSRIEENVDKTTHSPPEYVIATAQLKARDVWKQQKEENEKKQVDNDNDDEVGEKRKRENDGKNRLLVIGADTVVEIDGEILEKPKDRASAMAMLSRLSGKTHQVHTGVCLIFGKGNEGDDGNDEVCFVETTRVTFSELGEEMKTNYIDSGEPL